MEMKGGYKEPLLAKELLRTAECSEQDSQFSLGMGYREAIHSLVGAPASMYILAVLSGLSEKQSKQTNESHQLCDSWV